MSEVRVCRKCKTTKPASEFRTKYRCIECAKAAYRKWYKKNKKKRDKAIKKWRLANPEKFSAQKRRWLCKKRGVPFELVECGRLLREIRKVINEHEQSD